MVLLFNPSHSSVFFDVSVSSVFGGPSEPHKGDQIVPTSYRILSSVPLPLRLLSPNYESYGESQQVEGLDRGPLSPLPREWRHVSTDMSRLGIQSPRGIRFVWKITSDVKCKMCQGNVGQEYQRTTSSVLSLIITVHHPFL